MSISTVAVTGGNGKIGQEILAHLKESGYETANIARGKRREDISDTYITTDLLDAGETYGALSKANADAIIHMGTIPDPYSNPRYRTYQSNTMSAAHVLEASESLGLESCCLASSINVMGAEHQTRPPQVAYLPVDEDHPRTPDDIYGIAKHAMEVTADGFGRRPESELTISTLRYPWVPNEEEIVASFVESDRSMETLRNDDPWTGRDVLFSYIHIDDACTIARKAIEATYDGHESFWAVAGDTTAAVPTHDVTAEFFPGVEVRDDADEYETLFDISKAETMLDWTPEHSWRDI
ncbi:NAD-dependent epimerase/dehydratase family protein [Haloarcula laminariae]|uniref:NAD-dependent epimerase/dehydratase family protein n=1 Tax=Haloarcula laminariae TaxID=2961577 RepID=UPI0021C8EE83|nr:NAD(P)-dependent oxidoreductase [Halomicroarcula laminariae]